jgi:hypothetical protein
MCPGSPGDFVPTRLLKIELDDDGQVVARLVDVFSDAHTKWAALSYVWGGDQEFKTTVSSTSAMREPFSVQRLPQTLRDAVTVCRGLELDYLWADCLCIIQDDADDLAQELAIMPQIYQRAWVTISASTASNVSEGFLHDRGYKTMKSKAPISLSYLAKDDTSTGTVIIGEAEDVEIARQNALPIHDRAWYVPIHTLPMQSPHYNLIDPAQLGHIKNAASHRVSSTLQQSTSTSFAERGVSCKAPARHCGTHRTLASGTGWASNTLSRAWKTRIYLNGTPS